MDGASRKHDTKKKTKKKEGIDQKEEEEKEKQARHRQEAALRDAMSRAVLLVEVCEAGNESLSGAYLPRCGVERICWGYFLLYGDGTSGGSGGGAEVLQLPASNIHLQLFPDYSYGLPTHFPTPWYVRAIQRYMPSFWSPSNAVFALAKSTLSSWRSRKGKSALQQEKEAQQDAFRSGMVDGRGGYGIGWPVRTTQTEAEKMEGAGTPPPCKVVFGTSNDRIDDDGHDRLYFGGGGPAHIPPLFFLFQMPEARKVNFRGGMLMSVGYEEERWETSASLSHWRTTSTEMIKTTTTFSFSRTKHNRSKRKISKVLAQRMWRFSSPFASTPFLCSVPSSPSSPSVLVYEVYLLQQLLVAGVGRFSPFPSLPSLRRGALDIQRLEEGKEEEWRRAQIAQREMEAKLDQSIPTLLRQQRWRTFQRRAGERALLPNQWLGTFMVEGHVSCLAVSLHGRYVAVAVSHCLRYEIQLFDPLLPPPPASSSAFSHPTAPLFTLHGHTGHIHMLRFSPTDDRVLVSGGADRTVRVWRLEKRPYPPKEEEVFPTPYRPPSPFHSKDHLKPFAYEPPFFASSLETMPHPQEGVEKGKKSFLSYRCLYVLPHSFAVYDAVFHEGHLLTCGCSSSMWTWKIPLSSSLSSHEWEEDSSSGTHSSLNASTNAEHRHRSKPFESPAMGQKKKEREKGGAAGASHDRSHHGRHRLYDSDSFTSSSSSCRSRVEHDPPCGEGGPSSLSPYHPSKGKGEASRFSRSSPQKEDNKKNATRQGTKGGGSGRRSPYASRGGAESFDLVSRISNEENVVLWSLGNSAGRLHHQHHVWSVSSSGRVTCWRAVEETYEVPLSTGAEEEEAKGGLVPRGSSVQSITQKSVVSGGSTFSFPELNQTAMQSQHPAAGGRETHTPHVHRLHHRSDSRSTAVPGNGWQQPSSHVRSPPHHHSSSPQTHKETRSVWEISVRRHVVCEGAVQVSVEGKYVLVTCVEEPLRGTLPEPSNRHNGGSAWHTEEGSSSSSTEGGSGGAAGSVPRSRGALLPPSVLTMMVLDDATGQMLWKIGSRRVPHAFPASSYSDVLCLAEGGTGTVPAGWPFGSSTSGSPPLWQPHVASPLSVRHGMLLPGGEAFAIGTTEGRMVAWESVDGGLATPAKGYDALQLPHAIVRMAWAVTRHLVACASPLLLTHSTSSAEEEGEAEAWRGRRSREYTAISIVGRCTRPLPSALREVLSAFFLPPVRRILSSSSTAVEQFTVACGGILTEKRRLAIAMAQHKEQSQRRSIGKNRKRRLYEEKLSRNAKVPPLVNLVGFSLTEEEDIGEEEEEEEERESQHQSSESENDEKKKGKNGKKLKKRMDPLANELAAIQTSMFKQQQRLDFAEMNHLVEFWKDLSRLHRHLPQAEGH